MPLSVCVVGELDALLVNVSVEAALPAALGVNVTVNAADCPACNVIGRAIPDKRNSPLSVPADEIVIAVPLALRLPGSDALDPTVTLPKFSAAGATVSTPGLVPVPESAMLSGEFEAFEMMASVPLSAPAAGGANAAVKVTLCPGFSVTGSVSPVKENPVPETFACEIVTGDPPEFVKVSYRLAVLPTCTPPKPSEDGFALSVPAGAPAIATVYFAVARCPPLPCTVTLKGKLPAVVGVPESSSDRVSPDGVIPIPGGRLPAEIFQMNGTDPDLVLTAAE